MERNLLNTELLSRDLSDYVVRDDNRVAAVIVVIACWSGCCIFCWLADADEGSTRTAYKNQLPQNNYKRKARPVAKKKPKPEYW